MKILGIETSCDETSVSVVNAEKENISLLSNIISSSLPLHAKTGGIIPEVAAREQVKYIIPALQKAMNDANIEYSQIDAIAVTYGPGLIGSLLVGIETARTLSYAWNKPVIPVNHLFGHIYANFIGHNDIEFPAISLIVSGGHTDLLYFENHKKIKWLGGTRDDAAGEAFDKIGRLLNLAYPAGPTIEKLAKEGNPKAYNFPRPMIGEDNFDFSFSGLKAAVSREIKTITNMDDKTIQNICASTQEAIIRVLLKKTIKAVDKYKVKSLLIGGGVAANQTLIERFKKEINSIKIFVPEKSLCTDNAAMIAVASYFRNEQIPWQEIKANPELYFD